MIPSIKPVRHSATQARLAKRGLGKAIAPIKPQTEAKANAKSPLGQAGGSF
ncbi:MAG: hypothetical protein VX598_06295 [Verrucomicrobiota bacterium]|nr:hypothetical protein [Verrucomicrobiota bacterium]